MLPDETASWILNSEHELNFEPVILACNRQPVVLNKGINHSKGRVDHKHILRHMTELHSRVNSEILIS